jgi:hypothetical protein
MHRRRTARGKANPSGRPAVVADLAPVQHASSCGATLFKFLWKLSSGYPQGPQPGWRDLPQACSICRVTDEDFMLGVATIITLSTPLVLGLVALLRGRPEDYPEILRALFWRKEEKR